MQKILFGLLSGALGLTATVALPSPAQAQVNRQIWFSSSCPRPVRLFVHHQHGTGDWASHGWFDLQANQTLTMLQYSAGNPLQHLDGRPLYFYAETTDNSGHLWEGEFPATMNGVSYGLRQANLSMSGGRLQFAINCNTAAAPPAPRPPRPAPAPGATYGTVTLRSGFLPDPRIVQVQAGGAIAAERVGNACRGYIAQAPDVRLVYTAGSLPLIISAGSSADTTLVVRAPGGEIYCDDDGGQIALNPSVRLNSPRSGTYDIWVGTYSAGTLQPAALHISELRSQ